MELWIRSQDKESLRKIVDLKYQKGTIDDDNIEAILGTTQYDEWDVLGIYKSKERALEVLDEIQSILNLKDMYKYDRELVLKSWENVDAEQVKTVRQQMSVYEMPEE